MSSELLEISCSCIRSLLNYICNKTLSIGIFPDQLRFSVEKPLYKKGNENNVSNYQHVSLLTSFLNIFVKVMESWLMKHKDKCYILSMDQYGFRTK
jgi:hypothetical protein